ncbi:MAG: ribbon-helix-helix domain-containing protein [Candidatus Omnitrophica bacterium]|nr:ribbon-helix-helix domain-containing protein [Candidatus Omnitrophota bacterium]MBU1524260.1 ribbon-helix-helix domain-containing protein [Candidatus Omnitrophota bacterium]MBU1809974.1 ribbon-helix-helix domain-containing protein [Candidatus Omnitrophota bacterium]
MRNVVAISIPNNLLKNLTAEAKEEHTSRSDIIRRALKQHFFMRDFTMARNKAMAELAKKGITLTEEEIFEKVS